MGIYAQFYHLKHRADGSPFYEEGIGDRQIIRIDGRLSFSNVRFVAADNCAKRGYDGYRIGRGDAPSRLHWLTAAVQPVKRG